MDRFHRRSLRTFAHRGGKAHFRENSLQAFRHAISNGVSGVETDAWLTGDGAVVLHHDRWVLGRRGPHRVDRVRRADLPEHIPTLQDLYELVGNNTLVSVDVKDGLCAPQIVEVAASYGATGNLWLADSGSKHSDVERVASWRRLDPHVHLMDSTRAKRLGTPLAAYLRRLVELGVDTLNLRAKEWTPELIGAAQEAGLLCFAFEAHRTDSLKHVVGLGIDGVFSDHVDRLVMVATDERP